MGQHIQWRLTAETCLEPRLDLLTLSCCCATTDPNGSFIIFTNTQKIHQALLKAAPRLLRVEFSKIIMVLKL